MQLVILVLPVFVSKLTLDCYSAIISTLIILKHNFEHLIKLLGKLNINLECWNWRPYKTIFCKYSHHFVRLKQKELAIFFGI